MSCHFRGSRRVFFVVLVSVWAATVWASPETWVVLPDRVQPYRRASESARRLERNLRYGQKVQAERVADATGWLRIALSPSETGYLPEACVVRYAPTPKENLPIGSERVNRDTALSLKYRPSDLVEIPARWHYHAKARHRLRREAAQALEGMLSAAKKAGVHLRVASTYRPALQQRFVYLKKLESAGQNQKTVAKPGHSEHQLGTAVDITGLDPKTAMKPAFGDTPEGKWVEKNAPRYGFQLSYPRGSEARTGYRYEPWHVRYIGPQKRKASQ